MDKIKIDERSEFRRVCGLASALVVTHGCTFTHGAISALRSLARDRIPTSVLRAELYAWMSASGLTSTVSSKMCVACAPYSMRPGYREDIFGEVPMHRAAVLVSDEECGELMCIARRDRYRIDDAFERSERAKSLLGAE